MSTKNKSKKSVVKLKIVDDIQKPKIQFVEEKQTKNVEEKQTKKRGRPKGSIKVKPRLKIKYSSDEPLESIYKDIKNEEEMENFKKIKEERDNLDLRKNEKMYNYLYPNLNDPDFNIKITEKKEFYDTQYDGKIHNVKTQADILCNADFELAPHQLFVRNFLSFQTPYNSLLLYHGLGTGKTCSAISVAEEMRDYLNQMGISQRIIIVASPNVQENFKLQLFDERKLQLIDGLWNIRSCTGNKFLKEINPMNMKGLPREKIIRQIKRIINNSYIFLGYVEFANYITSVSQIDSDIKGEKKRKIIIEKKLKRVFNNRLIIIDEVHNIRITDDNKDKRVAIELLKLVNNVDNMRLLFLSATPMYNSYKEITWLVNLMNINDKRPGVNEKDIFNKDGSFKVSNNGDESGKELLERKATGYISFVRGVNPYTFPYRIWPEEFAIEHTFKEKQMPLIQLNGMRIIQNIEMLSLYLTDVGEYQQKAYNYIIDLLKDGYFSTSGRIMPSFENMESFGYTLLQRPLEALNMVYPSNKLNDILSMSKNDKDKPKLDPRYIVGKEGLSRIMKYNESTSPLLKNEFEYKTNDFGRIFSPELIGNYSGKIKNICDSIINSKGVILIYSQYIDGGLVPLALALEELGFTRAGIASSLFKKAPTEQIDALTYKPQNKSDKLDFNPAKYVMITGDKALSPDNVNDLKLVTNINNKQGEKVKVVLISQAGSEGLDFKFIRQVHVLDPWYNMNRIEQIIGRAVRTCSHKDLPFEERNVEIYLHGSILTNKEEEAVDLYIYRLAELKAVQIGQVSRVLKEIAVDCLLNYEQIGFTVDNINQTVKQKLSTGEEIMYAIGDRPYTSTCDYMSKCSYTCKPSKLITEANIKTDTYNENFIIMNIDKITQRIRSLFKDRYFYRKIELVAMINIIKNYPLVQINSALNQLIEDKNEFISDKYGRLGNLVNIDDLYLFQPLELDNINISIYDRSTPIDYKRQKLLFEVSDKFIEPEIEDIKISKEKIIIDDNINKLLREIEDSYNIAMSIKQNLDVDEWYVNASKIVNDMENDGIDRKILSDLIIDHICDQLLYDDKLKLLNYLEEKNSSKLNNIMRDVKDYFNKKIIKNKNLSGIIFQKEGVQQLVVLKKQDSTRKWIEAESEDYQDLSEEIGKIAQKFLPAKNKLNKLVGFISNFKKEYMIFKVKELTKPRHKGARCDQSQKGEALSILNKIIGENKYDKDTKINRSEICILQELLLRLFNKEMKNNKIWFLSPSEAVLINIEKIQL